MEQLSFLFHAAEVFSAAEKEPEESVTIVQLTNGTGSMNMPWIPFEPYRYVIWLLEEANTAELTDPAAVEKLLPWDVPAECRPSEHDSSGSEFHLEPEFFAR